MSKPSQKLVFVCATPSEAKPLVARYQLTKLQHQPFTVFGSADENIQVLVSGIGAQNCNQACCWYAGMAPNVNIWLNVGVAGHGHLDIGEHALVTKSTGAMLEQAYYPSLHTKWSARYAECLSLYAPSADYADCLFDMEANGFFCAARRFASPEFIHSIKVVSDNPKTPFEAPNKQHIEKLIENALDTIAEFAMNLVQLSRQSQLEPAYSYSYLAPTLNFRATHSEGLILEQMVNALDAVEQWSQQEADRLSQCETAKSAIDWLQQKHAQIEPRF